MSKLRSVFLAPIVALGLSGCGIFIPANRSGVGLGKLTLGDERKAVVALLGRPDVTRGNTTGESRKPVIIDEYHLYESGTAGWQTAMCIPTITFSCWMPLRNYSIYSMTYVNDRLTQWGRAGDWTK